MGLKLVALVAALVAATAVTGGADFLQTRQLPDGSFAERGQPGYPQLTAWATLGLTAAGATPQARAAENRKWWLLEGAAIRAATAARRAISTTIKARFTATTSSI